MHDAAGILLSLLVVFVGARVGEELAQRMRMPGVVGEILAGAVLGPSLLNWVSPDQVLNALAEIGVVFLLFAVGLETRLDDLKRVGVIAFLVGTLGVIVPFGGATVWAHVEGFVWSKSMFIAAAFVATSAGITARVLQDMRALQRREAHVILGAAVIDDILAMLLLGVVVSVQQDGTTNAAHLLAVIAEAVGFVLVVGWVGTRVARRRSHWLERPRMSMSALSIVLALCLGLAWLSTRFGLAAIIGAFLAGLIASETEQRQQLEHHMKPLLTLLTPFFFVMTGVKLDVGVFAQPDALLMLVVATVLAVLTKLLGAYLGALKLGQRSALAVGMGMVPRGEVGVVVASLGLAAGVFNAKVYAVIVAMSLLTSILTPPLLGWLLAWSQQPQDDPQPT